LWSSACRTFFCKSSITSEDCLLALASPKAMLASSKPRLNVTDSVNDHIRPYTRKIRSFTTIFRRITCDRITVVDLRDRIRRKTEQNGDRIRSPFTEIVNDRFVLRLSSYFSVYGHGDIRS
jgi:hypothetical protein